MESPTSSKEEQDTMKEVAHDNVSELERPHGSGASAGVNSTATNSNDPGKSQNISRAPSFSSGFSEGKPKKHKKKKHKKKSNLPQENQAGSCEKQTGGASDEAKNILRGNAARADQVKPVEDKASPSPGHQPDMTVSTTVEDLQPSKKPDGSATSESASPGALPTSACASQNAAGLSPPKQNGEASEGVGAADNAPTNEAVSSSRTVSMDRRSRNVSVAIPFNLFSRGQIQSRPTDGDHGPSASLQTITPSSSPVEKEASPPVDKKPQPADELTLTPTVPSVPPSTTLASGQSDTAQQSDGATQNESSSTKRQGNDAEYVEPKVSSPAKRNDDGASDPNLPSQGNEQAQTDGAGPQPSEHANSRRHQHSRSNQKQRQAFDKKRNDRQFQGQSPGQTPSHSPPSRSPRKNEAAADSPSPKKNDTGKPCTSQSNSEDEFPSLPAARKEERESPLSKKVSAWAASDRVRTMSRHISTQKLADGTTIPSPLKDVGRADSSAQTSPMRKVSGFVESASQSGSPVKSASKNPRGKKGEGDRW